jgi:hypothetical protein
LKPSSRPPMRYENRSPTSIARTSKPGRGTTRLLSEVRDRESQLPRLEGRSRICDLNASPLAAVLHTRAPCAARLTWSRCAVSLPLADPTSAAPSDADRISTLFARCGRRSVSRPERRLRSHAPRSRPIPASPLCRTTRS